ncbi:hypothetical protein K445DRAFT_10195 [Daldinia sp. EC12]|nr:hypothetical protein K445DRAFT_10195 [Daldinia sp. EC12]
MSTINSVSYYFYKKMVAPKRHDELWKRVALAYQTVTDHEPHPQEVLIRSNMHDTTIRNGRPQKDPKGSHLTISHKNADQTTRKRHITSHGYVSSETDHKFAEATHRKEKSDSTRKFSGGPVWPLDDRTIKIIEVWYSHLDY